VRVLLPPLLALILAAGCGAGDDDAALPMSQRDCFALWNGPGNEENRARVAEEAKFDVASASRFVQTVDYGEGASEEDLANAEGEGCSYLFHTDHRYLTFSGLWESDKFRWGTPPTISGSWSPEQDANARDNADVSPDGTLRKRPPPAPPTEPPPTVGPLEPPPPAWIETKRGSFWLGYSTFCWQSGCVDYLAPSCDAEERFVPTLVLDRGEIVHAHLGFMPRAVRLAAIPEDRSAAPVAIDHRLLPTSDEVVWRAEDDGPFHLMATARRGEGGADASYVACVQFR
jgi:hypothetical protein